MRVAILFCAAAVFTAGAEKFAPAEVAPLLKLAAQAHKNVLIRVGGDWCSECTEWQKVWANKDLADFLKKNFVPLRTDKPRDEARRLAAGYGWKRQLSTHPLMMVVRPDGTVLGVMGGDDFVSHTEYDPGRIKKLLGRYKPKPPSAGEQLDMALALALETNRKVFVIFGAVWCEPCHRLRQVFQLSRVSQVLQRNYVFLEYDVDNPSVQDVEPRLGRGRRQAIPWYVILAPDGKVIADATHGVSTLGIPSDPLDRERLLSMLRSTARDVTEEEFGTIGSALKLLGGSSSLASGDGTSRRQ